MDEYRREAIIRLRRGPGWDVKPEAEAQDGRRVIVTRGWEIDTEDSTIYVGETAWLLDPKCYEAGGPAWIASGDLEFTD